MTLRLVQSSERSPFEWANFASFATVTGGAKKKEKGGNWPYATLKEGKKFVLRRSGIPFRKEKKKEGFGGRGRSPPSTLLYGSICT